MRSKNIKKKKKKSKICSKWLSVAIYLHVSLKEALKHELAMCDYVSIIEVVLQS